MPVKNKTVDILLTEISMRLANQDKTIKKLQATLNKLLLIRRNEVTSLNSTAANNSTIATDSDKSDVILGLNKTITQLELITSSKNIYDIQSLIADKMRGGKRDAVVSIFEKYLIQNVSDLQEKYYDDFYNALNKI